MQALECFILKELFCIKLTFFCNNFQTAASSKDPDKSADPVYAQPMKVQSQVDGKIMSNDMGNSSTSGRGSSTADNGGQSTLSKHYHTVPDAVQLGKTISPQAVVSGDQLHGQLSGEFDQNGLPLVNKGNCAACGQSIVGQVSIGTAGLLGSWTGKQALTSRNYNGVIVIFTDK